MNRRDLLLATAGGLTTSLLSARDSAAQAAECAPSKLGIAQFSYSLRLRAERTKDLPVCIGDPLCFLKHCHEIGARGVQTSLGNREASYARRLRGYAERHGLFVEGSTSLPKDADDVDRFETHLRTAKAAGGKIVRIAIGGRRYEQFDRLEQFQAFANRSWRSIQLAEPVAARHGLALAIENHKDFRAPQMVGMLERLSSEHVGMCVDTGNSFALLEDPMEVVRRFAPWAKAAHLKDMAVCEYADGFLLADVPLGQGQLDLKAMVAVLRQARPDIRFSLEMATRDPLKVPCLTERYWATFPDMPGAELARALRYVRDHRSDQQSLPRVSHLPLAQQVKREEENIRQCLRYAAEHLNL